MSAIRNIIMDLGGVMLEWNPDHLLTRFQPEPELRGRLRAAIFGPDWRLFDRGRLSEAELIERLAAGSGQTRDELVEIIAAVRESLLEKPDTVKLVRALQQRGLDIYCLSNMPGPMYEHLRRRHTFLGCLSRGRYLRRDPDDEAGTGNLHAPARTLRTACAGVHIRR